MRSHLSPNYAPDPNRFVGIKSVTAIRILKQVNRELIQEPGAPTPNAERTST